MLQDLNQVASYSFLPPTLPDAQNTQKQKKNIVEEGVIWENVRGILYKTKQKISFARFAL